MPVTDHSLFPHPLTVIDTPGFGDSGGLQKDQEIADKIKEFFSLHGDKGISHLDGIGFVTQSAITRLTPTQKYIFEAVLRIFGRDVEKNIFVLSTFSDTKDPPVIHAILEDNFPYSALFKFNNSALYVPSEGADECIDKAYWKMGCQSFSDFFKAFQKMESVSLTMTRGVLDERDKLTTTIEDIRKEVVCCLNAMIHVGPQQKVQEKDLNMKTLYNLTKKATEHLITLEKIALRSHAVTPVDYIYILVDNEKCKATDGWIERVKYLEIAKQQANIISAVMDVNNSQLIQAEEQKARKVVDALKNANSARN